MVKREDIVAAGTQFSAAIEVVNRLNPEDLPAIITSQYQEIEAMDRYINNAMSRADHAKETTKKAKEAADAAKGKSAGFGHKKVAIEFLQDATGDIATAQSDLAQVQGDTLDALRISFDYEKKLGKITQYLFALGASNITANRVVVRELQQRLQGASEEELSELARQELESVVRQLKAQEDIMVKQETLSVKVKQQKEQINDNTARISTIEGMVASQADQLIEVVEKDLTQDQELLRQRKQGQEHSRRLDEIGRKDEEQDHRLDEMCRKDEEQDHHLDEIVRKDEEQDHRLDEMGRKDEEQDHRLDEIVRKDEEQDHRLDEIVRKDEEQDRRLDEMGRKDEEQGHRLDEISRKDEEQDRRLDEIGRKDEEQDCYLTEVIRKIEEQGQSLETKGGTWDSLITQHSDLLESHNKKFESNVLQLSQQWDSIELLQQENLALQERVRILEDNLAVLEDRSKTLATKVFTYSTLAVSAVSLIIGILHFFL